MLSLLNISNIALIDELRVEFGRGLNLLTGETGSGKSIIVDALGILIGGRFTSDLLKTGAERGSIEGLFSVTPSPPLAAALAAAGIEGDITPGAVGHVETPRRKRISSSGANSLPLVATRSSSTINWPRSHFFVSCDHFLSTYMARVISRRFSVPKHISSYSMLSQPMRRGSLKWARPTTHWLGRKRELDQLQRDEAERFQLVDILKFQINELERAQLAIGEDAALEEERRLLLNFEKLTCAF